MVGFVRINRFFENHKCQESTSMEKSAVPCTVLASTWKRETSKTIRDSTVCMRMRFEIFKSDLRLSIQFVWSSLPTIKVFRHDLHKILIFRSRKSTTTLWYTPPRNGSLPIERRKNRRKWKFATIIPLSLSVRVWKSYSLFTNQVLPEFSEKYSRFNWTFEKYP